MKKYEEFTEEYLKELDRTIPFIPLTRPYMFNGVMRRNKNFLKDFLISALKLPIEEEESDIIFLDEGISRKVTEPKPFIADIEVQIDRQHIFDVRISSKKPPKESFYHDKSKHCYKWENNTYHYILQINTK